MKQRTARLMWAVMLVAWGATIPWVIYLVLARGYPKAVLVAIPFYGFLVYAAAQIVKSLGRGDRS